MNFFNQTIYDSQESEVGLREYMHACVRLDNHSIGTAYRAYLQIITFYNIVHVDPEVPDEFRASSSCRLSIHAIANILNSE